MISQLTVYAKILCLLMTLFSAGASARNDIYLQSACNLKYLRAENGAVFADDNWQNGPPQTFFLEGKQVSDDPRAGIAVMIHSKVTNTTICFDKNWRIKAMRTKTNMAKRCQFFESIHGGEYRYASVANPSRFLGFQKNGKPIGPNRGVKAAGEGGGGKGGGGRGGRGRRRTIDEKCLNFQRVYANSTPTLDQNPQKQEQQQKQQQQQQQPKQKQKNLRNQALQQQQQQQQNRQQQRLPEAKRKDNPGLESPPGSGGNSLHEGGSYLANTAPTPVTVPGQPYPHPHRHKHGVATRKGKAHRQSAGAVAHPNLDTGVPVASPASATAVGKSAGHHRRHQLNAAVDEPSVTTSASSSLILAAIGPKQAPKSSQPVRLGPDAGSGGAPRRERQFTGAPPYTITTTTTTSTMTNSHETSSGGRSGPSNSSSSIGGVGGPGTGKKKSTNGGRHASKVNGGGSRGLDKRSQG